MRDKQSKPQGGGVSGTGTTDLSKSTHPSEHSPSNMIGLLLLLIPRVAAAFFAPILDCDETFNYWEPFHFLLFSRGTRTWEYSPVYGLRSYLYLMFYWPATFLAQLLGVESQFGKIGVFYFVRCGIAVVSAICQHRLITAVATKGQRYRWLHPVLIFFFAFSPATFHSSVSFLPQTFTQQILCVLWANWIEGRLLMAVFWTGLSVLLGWPFVAVMALPLAIEVVWRYKKQFLVPPILVSIGTVAVTVGPSLLVDFLFYRKWVWAILNIALYNGNPTDPHGAALYGVEPWTFYVKNLALNFNFILPLACLSPLFLLTLTALRGWGVVSWAWRLSVPLWLWMAAMFYMPHKEERFLFVVYPLFCVLGAYSLCVLTDSFSGLFNKQYHNHQRDSESRDSPNSRSSNSRGSTSGKERGSSSGNSNKNNKRKKKAKLGGGSGVAAVLVLMVCVGVALLSLSRSAALVIHYRAPVQAYKHITQIHPVLTAAKSHLTSPSEIKVCVGKEWYRFPSHFFLPHSDRPMRLEFIDSDFNGILPKQFDQDKTWDIPTNMNDLNQKEASRLVNVSACDVLVDLDLPSQREPHWHLTEEWKVSASYPFLDAAQSPALYRAFYIPFTSSQRNRWAPYNVLVRKNKSDHGLYADSQKIFSTMK